MASTPNWARELVAQVCKDYRRTAPKLQWYQSVDRMTKYPKPIGDGQIVWQSILRKAQAGSSGYASRRWGIHVTAGSDPIDTRYVLLHELAHWLMMRRQKGNHTAQYWAKCFELVDHYGDIVSLDYALRRGKSYRANAQMGYNRYLKQKALARN